MTQLYTTKQEVEKAIEAGKTVPPGDRSYTFVLYQGIQFVVVCWNTPTGQKVQFRVLKQLVSTLNEVQTIIDEYWRKNR